MPKMQILVLPLTKGELEGVGKIAVLAGEVSKHPLTPMGSPNDSPNRTRYDS
jgi:hypothetical protein